MAFSVISDSLWCSCRSSQLLVTFQFLKPAFGYISVSQRSFNGSFPVWTSQDTRPAHPSSSRHPQHGRQEPSLSAQPPWFLILIQARFQSLCRPRGSSQPPPTSPRGCTHTHTHSHTHTHVQRLKRSLRPTGGNPSSTPLRVSGRMPALESQAQSPHKRGRTFSRKDSRFPPGRGAGAGPAGHPWTSLSLPLPLSLSPSCSLFPVPACSVSN